MNRDQIQVPTSFAQTVQLVENYALEQIERETAAKQLYYHTVTHAIAVKRRAKIIFQAVKPYWEPGNNALELDRIASSIALSAVAHDLVQEIFPATKIHSPRQRPARVSEFATIDKLTKYINSLNQQLSRHQVDDLVKFNELDIQIITEAIAATICELDPLANDSDLGLSSNSIYQPYLYNSSAKISWVANIIALADLGTLGMEGATTYLHEGVLIFLEENLDLVELITNKNYSNSQRDYEGIGDRDITKKRLLNMTRFMVSLAKDRQIRFKQEITAFPEAARHILEHQVFKYLSDNTINEIERITPTDERSSLAELLAFFNSGWHG